MGNLRIRRPSPALIISLIALFLAAGGIGYATAKISGKTLKKHSTPGNRIKDNTITNKQVKESSLSEVPKAASAATATSATNALALGGKNLNQVSMWAVIDQAGTAVRNSGGVTAQQTGTGTGEYRVTFPINVAGCQYNATPGSTSNADDPGNLTPALVMVAPASSNPNAITYLTTDDTGAPIGTEPVFLSVNC